MSANACIFFFFSSSKARGSCQTYSGHQYHYGGRSHRMVTRISLLLAVHGLVSVEDLWRQKLCLAIISDILKKGTMGMSYQETGEASCKGEWHLAPLLA